MQMNLKLDFLRHSQFPIKVFHKNSFRSEFCHIDQLRMILRQLFSKNESNTVVCLKSGLACVAIFGESPDFLDKSFSPKIQKSGFLGKVLFFEKAKVLYNE